MKKILSILVLLFTTISFCQVDGQDFCKGITNGNFFPLNIPKKKIFWYNTFYLEENSGFKYISGKKYKQVKQTWENKTIDFLYLSEEEFGKVTEWDEAKNSVSVRYDVTYKKNESWENIAKNVVYKILSFNGTLRTPFCNYENLLVIQAKYEKITFNFYYLKGLGYVGATQSDKVISYITPQM